MKKIILTIFLLISIQAFASECEYNCPSPVDNIENETIINKVTGVNFLTKKIIESLIEKELNGELNSDIKAQLTLFNVKRTKQGEFKALKLASKKILYRALSLTDFEAQSICEYNKVIYKEKKLYYPYDLPFKFSGKITNEDIQNTINSAEFQKELQRNYIKVNGIKMFEALSPQVVLKDNRAYFTIHLKTLFARINISFSAQIEAENNKIVLKDITFNSKSNIINESMSDSLTKDFNPISYQTKVLEDKHGKIDIKSAKISGDEILINGIYTIKQNYGGVNE